MESTKQTNRENWLDGYAKMWRDFMLVHQPIAAPGQWPAIGVMAQKKMNQTSRMEIVSPVESPWMM